MPETNNETQHDNQVDESAASPLDAEKQSMRVPGGAHAAPRKKSYVLPIVCAVGVIAVAAGILIAVMNPFAPASSGASSEAESASSVSPEQASASSASVDSPASSSSSASSAAASSSAASSAASASSASASAASSRQQSQQSASSETDLSWRDADFAVDPNRTDWNFSDNGRKVVYLTIDDGPSDKTQQVLDILDRYNCKATFFVTGFNPDYYDMIGEAYRRGHTIGMHTMWHDYGEIYSSEGAFFDDLDQIGQVVESQIGYRPCFIRFPGGSSNSMAPSGRMRELSGAVQARGYQYYDWNVSVGDGAVHTSDELYEYATEGNPPGEYATNIIMLCHDSEPKQSTVDALPRIIEHYQRMGYSFEAIDRTTMVWHHL